MLMIDYLYLSIRTYVQDVCMQLPGFQFFIIFYLYDYVQICTYVCVYYMHIVCFIVSVHVYLKLGDKELAYNLTVAVERMAEFSR